MVSQDAKTSRGTIFALGRGPAFGGFAGSTISSRVSAKAKTSPMGCQGSDSENLELARYETLSEMFLGPAAENEATATAEPESPSVDHENATGTNRT
jgi:hypothetical protein